jgi:SagB-type dehydrogenase family enzyme
MLMTNSAVRSIAELAFLSMAIAAEGDLTLPAPRMEGGRPLMQALKERKTTRQFLDKPLPLEVLSDLLWAAFGVNRPSEGKRTAPSAWNHQEIDIYVFTAGGVYLYDARQHLLKVLIPTDGRGWTGDAEFVRQAPVSLVYVADFSRMGKSEPEKKLFYGAVDTGFIGQNVYLYCASEGLGTVIHDSADKPALAAKLGLRSEQQIILGQAVGYPSR